MPPHSPAAALPIAILPNGVGTLTAGSRGQEFGNTNPLVDGRNGRDGAMRATYGPPCGRVKARMALLVLDQGVGLEVGRSVDVPRGVPPVRDDREPRCFDVVEQH